MMAKRGWQSFHNSHFSLSVRLLKAFQIDFSWYRLSSWINLTEQWPLRASMIVLQHDQSHEQLDDTVSLQSLYEK